MSALDPILAPINCPIIIEMPNGHTTWPKYTKIITAPTFVEKFNAFAIAVALIRLWPRIEIPDAVKKLPVPGPNIPSYSPIKGITNKLYFLLLSLGIDSILFKDFENKKKVRIDSKTNGIIISNESVLKNCIRIVPNNEKKKLLSWEI